jgi:hypothetical protein
MSGSGSIGKKRLSISSEKVRYWSLPMIRQLIKSRRLLTMSNHRPYATIITTIALALFALFWTTIDSQLKALDIRLRCVEQQVSAIAARLDVEIRGLNGSPNRAASPPAPSRQGKPTRAAPIPP